MRSAGTDVDLAIERGLECGVDAAFRYPIEVGFAQRDVDDVVAVVAGLPHDVAGQTERRQHAVGVIVGSTADEGDNTDHRFGAESLAAQIPCRDLSYFDVLAGNQQFDFSPVGGRFARSFSTTSAPI